MRRGSLLWKVYAGVIALVAIALLFVWLVASRGLANRTRDAVRDQLTAQARMVRDLVRREAPAALQTRVRELGAESATRFSVIAADGRVLADSREEPARMDNHAGRPEVRAAWRDGHGWSVRRSATLNREMLYVAVPVGGGAGAADRRVIRAALGLAAIDEQLAELRWALTLTALAALAIALPLALVLARSFTAPVTRLIGAAESIANGEYDATIPVTGDGELGDLARSLRRLTDDARERIADSTAEHAQLRAILAGIVEGVLALDTEERIIHCNGPAAAMLRIANDAPVGHHLWAVTRVAEVCDVLRGCIRTGEGATHEVRAFDGPRAQVIEVRSAALRDAHGAPVGAVAVLHDVTQMHRLQAMRRDFVANVSHELKTPITAVRGQVETILEDPDMPEATQRSFLEKVLAQTLRLSAIVGDLLTLSRLESADSALDHVSLDLRDVVRIVVAELRGPAESNDVKLEVESPDAPVVVQGDQPALEQAVRNLADNGIKYTPEGGVVTLRVTRAGGVAQIEVEDTGPGIAAEHRDRVFERFYRVDKARSRALGGTGLGLSIVKHVALAHGGSVSVSGAPGKGACFRVRLPAGDSLPL